VSPHDSLGSNLIVQVKGGKVMRVLPLENENINECWLSDKDRFSYEALDNASRLVGPMIKQDGKWIDTDWQTALEYVAHGLRNIRHEHGADSIAAVATANSTVEELYLLQKAMRGFGIENVDFRMRQTDFALDGAVVPSLGMPIAELSTLKRVLVVGSFLRKDHPLAATRLRAAVKSGARLSIVHGSFDDNLIPTANRLIAAPSDWLAALSEVVVAIAAAKSIAVPAGFDGIEAGDVAKAIAATLVVENAADLPGAVLLGNAAANHPQASKLHAAAQWIAEQTGARFGYFVEAANTVGGYLVNAVSKNAANLFAQPKKAYVLLNAEPELDAANPQQAIKALQGAEMVVAMSAFKHGMDYADVLLPISPFSETAGTFVNCEGRAQSFNGTVRPLGETRPAWKVLRVLGNLLGLSGFDYENSEAIRDEALGKGNTDLSAKLNNVAKLAPTSARFGDGSELERLADVPIYFADAIARRSEPLLRTADANAPLATLSARLAEQLGVNAGDAVTVSQGTGSVNLVAAIDTRLPANVVRVAAAHELTSVLGDMFGPINVAKA
jgi:NADH-quinone oxidoreductase subunit G